MKVLLLFMFLINNTVNLIAQSSDEFTTINLQAPSIPQSETYTTESIARYIKNNYKTEKEKLFAIYSWVTNNIKYDTDSMYAINWGRDPNAKITASLRRKKGVCENFAAIFNDITIKCGISSIPITGYTKQYGSFDKNAHTWCAVYFESKWFLCDPTWDIGFSRNTKYFLISPEFFIESHMPFDPLWLLLSYSVSHKEFNDGNTHSTKGKPYINFTDSVNAYTNMTELQQLETSLYRIKKAGIANDLIKTRVTYLQMEISIIYQEKTMNMYNSAVADLNNAITLYNQFVQYRNNRFVPLKPENEIKEMLVPIEKLLSSAHMKIIDLDKSDTNFQYDTDSISIQLEGIKTKMELQKDFLKHYFTIALSERVKLFY